MGHRKKGSRRSARSKRSSAHSRRREQLQHQQDNTKFGIVLIVTVTILVSSILAISFASKYYFGKDDTGPGTNVTVPGTSTYADMITSKGKIVLLLNEDAAPKTVQNFERYANDGFYDGTIFHRVIKDFMIQGGGFYSGMQPKQPSYGPIKNEALTSGLANEKYTVAMARTNEPDSATSQFFINTAKNDFLNPGGNSEAGYCVFARVVEGFGVVDNIQIVPTTSVNGHDDVPISDVTIISVTIRTGP